MMSGMQFLLDHWRDGVEVLILWIGIYQVYRAFRATRGASILVGIVMILAIATSLAFIFQLKVIAWILTRAVLYGAFALIIIFQPELRSALAKLGNSRFFKFSKTQRLEFTTVLADSAIQLSKNRIGALFALEKEISLSDHQETGVRLDAEFSAELAQSIFYPKAALHDGGMILSQGRVASAGCVFPVSQRELTDRTLNRCYRNVRPRPSTNGSGEQGVPRTGTGGNARNGQFRRHRFPTSRSSPSSRPSTETISHLGKRGRTEKEEPVLEL